MFGSNDQYIFFLNLLLLLALNKSIVFLYYYSSSIITQQSNDLSLKYTKIYTEIQYTKNALKYTKVQYKIFIYYVLFRLKCYGNHII